MKNANLAFNIEHAVSEHKETIALKSKEVDELHRQLGKRTAELLTSALFIKDELARSMFLGVGLI